MTPQQANELLRAALKQISETRFGYDGDCGVTSIAEDALEATADLAPAPTSEPGARDAALEEAASKIEWFAKDLHSVGRHEAKDLSDHLALLVRNLKLATPASPATVCAPNCFYGDCPPCVEAGIAPASPAVPAAPLAPSEDYGWTPEKIAEFSAVLDIFESDPAPLVAQASPVCETGAPGSRIYRWFKRVPQGTMLYQHPASEASPLVEDAQRIVAGKVE